MQLQKQFIEKGFTFIQAENYLQSKETANSLSVLNHLFDTQLAPDGPRNRAYLKLEWVRETQKISIAQNQCYFQSAERNKDDGGKSRQFLVMNSSVLDLPVVQNLMEKNLQIVSEYKPLSEQCSLTIGLHFIQYSVDKGKASYSSPVGLHIDDEPLVFVHLIDLSPHALGGDNLIATIHNQEITNVIRLERPMDTILLNNNCYHAVTPLGSKDGTAKRNIILFTVEPLSTQLM